MFSSLPISIMNDALSYALVPFFCQHPKLPYLISPSVLSRIPEATEYLLAFPHLIDWDLFSSNPDDKAVSYLLEHEDKINQWNWSMNKNPRCIRYLLKLRKTIPFYMYQRVCYCSDADVTKIVLEQTNPLSWAGICSNPSEESASFLLNILENNHSSVRNINWNMLHQNTNPRIVAYLIADPDEIDMERFQENNSDLAVRYCIQHTEHFYKGFSSNPNPLAIRFLLDHPEHRYPEFCGHATDEVVAYYLNHPEEIDKWYWSSNTHPKAVDWMLNQPEEYYFENHRFLANPGLFSAQVDEITVHEWLTYLTSYQ